MNTLRIESCSFGSIVIDGKTYTNDLIILPDRKILRPWWRQRGHRLSINDLTALLDSSPEVIIAGTGINGRVKPDETLKQDLSRLAIDLIAEPNDEAIRLLNGLKPEKRVGACFHLTC
jgi:hypothetical protein